MVQKYVAILVVLTMFCMVMPAFGQDYVNPKYLPHSAGFSGLVGNVGAFAPVSGPVASPMPAPVPAATTGGGGHVGAWIGTAMLLGGIVTMGSAALIKQPTSCYGFAPSLCTSNYGSERQNLIVIGGIVAVSGLALATISLIHGKH